MTLLFEDLKTRGEAALTEARTRKQTENLELDFKEDVADHRAMFDSGHKLTRDGRAVIAKTLSAFANSAGGLLVIGVKCRPVDGIDAVSELTPMPGLERRLSTVNGAIPELLHPRHAGVRLLAIPSAADAESGYLAVEVERSERRPHQSVPHGQYFKRSGSVSQVMEHYELEDQFNRATAPIIDLKPELMLRSNGHNAEGEFINIWGNLQVYNEGFKTARHVAVHLSGWSGMPAPVGSDAKWSSRESTGAGAVLRLVDGAVINPGETRSLGHIGFTITRAGRMHVPVMFNLLQRDWRFSTDYMLVAEDMRPHFGTIDWREEDFVNFLKHWPA